MAPGVTEKLAQSLINDIPIYYQNKIITNVTGKLISWWILLLVLQKVWKKYSKIQDYHNKREWDYVVGITDLPMFYHQNVLALDINKKWRCNIFVSCFWMASCKESF